MPGKAHAGGGEPWELVREVGLDYAPRPRAPASVALNAPVAVHRLPQGSTLCVDDTSADGDPLRLRARTFVLSPAGEVVLDSQACGYGEAYGSALADGSLALLDPVRGEVVRVSPHGEPLGRFAVAHLSSYRARSLHATGSGTWIVAFLGTYQEVAFAEVAPGGELLWHTGRTSPEIGIPGSVQRLEDGTLLVADEFHSVVWTLARDGTAAVRYGRFHQPSSARDALHRPRSAHLGPDGTLLIADSHNHRILRVARDGSVRRVDPADGVLLAPSFATPLPGGGVLACDAGNRCVLELDPSGSTRIIAGPGLARARHLSFPRSVAPRGTGYVVADSAGDRIVQVDGTAIRPVAVDSPGPLFWPRSVRDANGGLVIADGRNGRVLLVDPGGRVTRSLARVRFAGAEIALRDPHDASVLGGGRLLVVDSAQHLVLECDWDGEARWMIGRGFGPELRDPHSAQLLPDGRVLVSDPGNHRVLFVDPSTGAWSAVGELAHGGSRWAFRSPRHASLAADGTLAVVDTANNRVLLHNAARGTASVIDAVPGSPRPELRFPRWACVIDEREVVISDYFHHRIVHLRRRG